MNKHLSMARGDAKRWGFQVVDPEDLKTPVDITGAEVRFTAKRRITDTDAQAVIVKILGVGITITDGPNGRCTVQLSASDTDSLVVPLTLLWDLQVTDSTGPQTVLGGRLLIAVDVTTTP